MKKLLLLNALMMSQLALATDTEVVGKWKTIDDESQKPKSIVQIEKVGSLYEGKVIQLFKAPTEDQNPKCIECKGELKDTPIVGLRILQGLQQRDSDWGDGKILDPNNGKLYDVKMELIDGGTHLKVRGYIGFSLIGRTQIWERAD